MYIRISLPSLLRPQEVIESSKVPACRADVELQQAACIALKIIADGPIRKTDLIESAKAAVACALACPEHLEVQVCAIA